MSWKIYNGMILRNATLEEALVKGKQLREACLPKAKKMIQTKAAEDLALRADIEKNNIIGVGLDELPSVREIIQEAQKKVLGEGVREPEWDLTFNLCFIPEDGHILTLHFMEGDPGFTDEMEKLGFEDFHYQTSSEKPSEFSDEEWDIREKYWKKAGQMDYKAPSEMGLGFDVITWRDISMAALDAREVEAIELDEERRKRAVAGIKAHKLLEDWIRNVKPPHSKIIARIRKVVKDIQHEMVTANKWFNRSSLF